MLLAARADPSARHEGWPPVLRAVVRGPAAEAALRALLAARADPAAAAAEPRGCAFTPLLAAADHGYVQVRGRHCIARGAGDISVGIDGKSDGLSVGSCE